MVNPDRMLTPEEITKLQRARILIIFGTIFMGTALVIRLVAPPLVTLCLGVAGLTFWGTAIGVINKVVTND